MEENPYEAPKTSIEPKKAVQPTSLLRFAMLTGVAVIIAFLLVQLWAANAPWSPF
jgi:hypothetical protein